MKRIFLISVLMITLSATILLFYSCIPFGDGSINVTGTVYEWVDAPAGENSKIYAKVCDTWEEARIAAEDIMANIPGDIAKVAVDDAVVAVGHKDTIENIGEEGYRYKVYTEPNGSFEEGWMTVPGRSQLIVKVAKSGYIDVTRELEFTGATSYAIVAILVKGDNSN